MALRSSLPAPQPLQSLQSVAFVASVITRVTWIDDDGSGTTGTVIDNARKNSDIYAKIDEMFAGAGSYSTFTFGGLIRAEGFGDHYFQAGGATGQQVRIRNTTAGAGAFAGLALGNDLTADVAGFLTYSSTATGGYHEAYPRDGLYIKCAREGGIALSAEHASSTIRFYTGATPTERIRLYADGTVGIGGALSTQGGAAFNVVGGATSQAPENATYGRAIQTTRAGTNTAQHIAMIRSGTAIWSLGFAYNTSTFAIGAGQATDANFTAAAAALTIDTSGRMQLPLQPGFLAYNGVTDTGIGAGDQVVDFDTEDHDVGGVFASDTFTAPVAGKYRLSASVYIVNQEGATRSFSIRFATSATADWYFGTASVLSGAVHQFVGSIDLPLGAGETAQVIIAPGGGGSPNYDIASTTSGNVLTWFSGRLVA